MKKINEINNILQFLSKNSTSDDIKRFMFNHDFKKIGYTEDNFHDVIYTYKKINFTIFYNHEINSFNAVKLN